MSFFVSESLKGRVTEESLINSESEEKLNTGPVWVSVSFEDLSHEFYFVSLQKRKLSKVLTFEVPLTYKFLFRMLNSRTTFTVFSNDGPLEILELVPEEYELIKQNERSCYLLKIVITE